jgi:hypothetical protein
MATREQLIDMAKSKGKSAEEAATLADAYLAKKSGTAPAPKPAPAAKKSEPVAEKKASPPATRTAPAPAPAAKKAEPVAEQNPAPAVKPMERGATDDNPGYRGVKPSSNLGIVDAAKSAYKVATTPINTPWRPKPATAGPVAPPSTIDEKGNTRVLGAKPTIQNFTPAPPPPPPAPGRAPAGMTMSSFSGGVPSRASELGARDTATDARYPVTEIRRALKEKRPAYAAQIDAMEDYEVMKAADLAR